MKWQTLEAKTNADKILQQTKNKGALNQNLQTLVTSQPEDRTEGAPAGHARVACGWCGRGSPAGALFCCQRDPTYGSRNKACSTAVNFNQGHREGGRHLGGDPCRGFLFNKSLAACLKATCRGELSSPVPRITSLPK